jgi:carbon-monoxide dehydrogenase medium subunit
MIVEAVAQVGHAAIRNRGTVGGSLAHSDPAAEWTALALALDAELDVVGPSGSRVVAAGDFFVTYFTTALAPDELLVRARFRIPNGRSGSTFVELARRHGDFALAGVGALVTLDDDDVVADGLIGVGATAVRASSGEEAVRGRRPTADVLVEAAAAVDADIDPNTDVHASADYRRLIAGVLVRRALETAIARARGGDDGRS